MNKLRLFRRLKNPIFALCLCVFAPSIFAHSPHDTIDALAVSPDFRSDQTIYTAIERTIFKSENEGRSWRRLANGVDNKYNLSSIAISPKYTKDQTLFVSSLGDGIYRSVNAGYAWEKINRGVTHLTIEQLAICSANESANLLLAVSGQGDLFKTDDDGNEWFPVFDSNNKITTVACIAGENETYIFAPDSGGRLHYTSNGGKSWSHSVLVSKDGKIESLTVSPNFETDKTIYLGTDGGVVLRSTDGGLSVEHSSKPLGNGKSAITSIAISSDFATDKTLFATTWDEAVFASQDRGSTWTKLANGLTTDPQASDPKYLSPQFRTVQLSNGYGQDKNLFVGGYDGLFFSKDQGENWTQLETLMVGLIKGLAASSDAHNSVNLALSTYGGGSYFTTDNGKSWRVGNKGVKTTRFSDIVFSPDYSNDRTLFAGVKGHLLKSVDGGSTWKSINHGESKVLLRMVHSALRKVGLGKLNRTIFDSHDLENPYPTSIVISPQYSKDDTLFFATRRHGIYRSQDAGETSTLVWDADHRTVRYIVMSPSFNEDRTIFASVRGKGIYKTVDGGQTWESANNGLDCVARWESGKLPPVAQDVKIVISPVYASDGVIFAGTACGVYKTINAGNEWKKIGVVSFGAESPEVSVLVLSPEYASDNQLFVNLKGQGLHRSHDGGNTFSYIPIPEIALAPTIKNITFSPNYAHDGAIYAAAEDDLLISVDRGDTWRLVARPVRYEDMREPIDYSGEWFVERKGKYSAQSAHYSNVPGDRAQLSFWGAGISWVGSKAKDHGHANIYIDGELNETVDLYSATRFDSTDIFSVKSLDKGNHSITIEVSGAKNPASKGGVVSIDAFDILP